MATVGIAVTLLLLLFILLVLILFLILVFAFVVVELRLMVRFLRTIRNRCGLPSMIGLVRLAPRPRSMTNDKPILVQLDAAWKGPRPRRGCYRASRRDVALLIIRVLF